MLVPETAVYEDDRFPRREHKIGNSGQVAPVQDVTVAEPVEKATDLHFRSGVGTPYPTHDLAAS